MEHTEIFLRFWELDWRLQHLSQISQEPETIQPVSPTFLTKASAILNELNPDN